MADDSNSNSPETPFALYLYAFIAGLVLIFFGMTIICINSYLTRRRLRRTIEDALRTGAWIPSEPSSQGPGSKPTFYEAYLETIPDSGEEASIRVAGIHHDWNMVMPLSATDCASTRAQTPNLPPVALSSLNLGTSRRRRGTILQSFFRGLGVNQYVASTPSSSIHTPGNVTAARHSHADNRLANSDSKDSAESANTIPSSVRVTVLIAMPSQPPLSSILQQNKTSHLTEDDLPHVELGVLYSAVADVCEDVKAVYDEEKIGARISDVEMKSSRHA